MTLVFYLKKNVFLPKTRGKSEKRDDGGVDGANWSGSDGGDPHVVLRCRRRRKTAEKKVG